MPSASKNGPALFLGLELAIDQLRASVVDESLELVGVECVDFDSECQSISECSMLFSFFIAPRPFYIVLLMFNCARIMV
jgi:xylulokinase